MIRIGLRRRSEKALCPLNKKEKDVVSFSSARPIFTVQRIVTNLFLISLSRFRVDKYGGSLSLRAH